MIMMIIEMRVGIGERIIEIAMAPTGLEPVLMMSPILAPIPVQMMRKEEEEEEEEGEEIEEMIKEIIEEIIEELIEIDQTGIIIGINFLVI
jgi:hypothetical protein